MNETEKVTQWVEFKIGKLLTENIQKNVISEASHFNVDECSRILYETYFSRDTDIGSIKSELCDETLRLNFDSDEFCLTESFSQESSNDDPFDFQPPSLDDIISDLQNPSEEVQIKALESLEASSAEEFIVHTSWTMGRKILQGMLKKRGSSAVSSHVLQLFRRFLRSNDSPKVVGEGFSSLAESITCRIEAINGNKQKEMCHGVYDFKKGVWLKKDSNSVVMNTETERNDAADVTSILKAIWLLVECQKGIPTKWSRFNEKRLREIVFSFVHMLSSTTNLKGKDNICGLELLSVLDPKSGWCKNWCHGATGRSLLCSALKTHKKFFTDIVDFILIRMKNKESRTVRVDDKSSCNCTFKLPPINDVKLRIGGDNAHSDRNKSELFKEKYSARLSVRDRETAKGNRSAPPFPTEQALHKKTSETSDRRNTSDWMVHGIPKRVVNEAKFCHCVSMVVYLIRYRGGRSLFPLEVTSRRRRMTIPDFVQTVIHHVNTSVFFSEPNPLITDEYKEHMLKLVEILKSI